VWEESTPTRGILKGNLYFCVGGVNAVNPVNVQGIKNEVLVYADTAVENGFLELETIGSMEGLVFNINRERYTMQYQQYVYIFLDFAGSMAFFNDEWKKTLNDINEKIKACFIMGGVYSDKAPKTMPSIPGVINRFSCATMNQLYHPQRTQQFFDFLDQNMIKTFVVSNNAVHDLAVKGADGKALDTGWMLFLKSNGIDTRFLTQIAYVYYNSSYNPPRKAFDFYTALALCRYSIGLVPTKTPKRLFYDDTYGISLLGTSQTFADAVAEYKQHIDTLPEKEIEKKGVPFTMNKKLTFVQELNIMATIPLSSTNALRVIDVEFDMNATTYQLSVE
jgi:hypothetical protein